MFAHKSNRQHRRSSRQTKSSPVRRFRGRTGHLEHLENRSLMAIDLGNDTDIVSTGVDSPNPAPAPNGGSTVGGGMSGGGTTTTTPLPNLPLTATFVNGQLSVSGTNNADNLFVFKDGTNVTVREVVKNRVVTSVPLKDVRSILIDGNAGDDWINVDSSLNIPATISGELGNDILHGGAAGDTILGGLGSDQIFGHGGNDQLNGEAGNDLLVGGVGKDVMFGGFGDDYLVGGDGNDWLAGDAGNDQLFGEKGVDLVFGGAGDDMLDGGDGNDELYGDAGNDAMYGGQGDDYLRGFAGDDQMRGEAGNDKLVGDAGNDLLDGGAGIDILLGDAGNDAVIGGLGNDQLSGGPGSDWMYGGSGNDTMNGGDGNDVMQGAAGTDTISAGTGSNKVFQELAPGQQDLEIQVRFLGGIGNAIVSAGKAIKNFVSDVIDWTADKIKAVASDVYNWFTSLDDRLLRLSQDIRNTLSHWPWQADFWKDFGRAIVDGLEVAGLGELWEIASEIIKPWQRGLTAAEIQVGRSVFGDAIPWTKVRLDEFSLMAQIGRTHTTGFIINSVGDINDPTMIHEFTHVWQYVKDGLVYIPEAIDAQAGEGYEYGGVADLRAKKAAGLGMSAYNREQQGEIVRNYYELRLEIDSLRTAGKSVPLNKQQDLEVYIEFVRQVSTLTRVQLGARPNVLATQVNGTTFTKLA